MLRTGLVSISFRNLSPGEITDCTTTAGLSAIEWGADVHVPAGNVNTAGNVRELTRAAGLVVAAYGSYFRAGCSDDPAGELTAVLDCASELGARIVRIWAGNKDSSELGSSEYNRLIEESRIAADMAALREITLSFECHNNTCTDDYRAALKLLERIGRDNVTMYFQPNQKKSEEYNLAAARALAPHTTNVHVFNWKNDKRYPLCGGVDLWRQYADVFRTDGRDHAFLLEFMHDDQPASLPGEADALRRILA